MTGEISSEQIVSGGESSGLLPERDQKRNMLLFAACMGLNYLAAPISYVGIVQAALCERLGATPTEANLPASAYMGFTIMPLFVAWYRPKVSQLKSTLVWCFLLEAVVTLAMPIALISAVPARIKIAMVILHAAVFGATNPTAVALCWEVLGRGVHPQRRGWALSLAFGAGPFLAVVGSLVSQLLLSGSFWKFAITPIEFPWNFAALYGAVAPMMAVGAWLASRYVVPIPEVDRTREKFMKGVFGGLWNFLREPLLLTTTIVVILVYMGNAISSNMNLYSPYALGDSPDKYAGIQNAMRFGFKVFAGVLLGWLVTRTHPKAGLLATSSLYVVGQIWAMFAVGPVYLLAFGIFGMGELVGVYAPNYILAASRKRDIRRNQSFHTLMMMPASLAGLMFGEIARRIGDQYDLAAGYRASFAVCAALMFLGILLTLWKLPAHPQPGDEG